MNRSQTSNDQAIELSGQMVKEVKRLANDWQYDAVSMGYPGPVVHGRPLREPDNLGR
jgi:polyphosphate glucokinase